VTALALCLTAAGQEPPLAPTAGSAAPKTTPAPAGLKLILLKPAIRLEDIPGAMNIDQGIPLAVPNVNRKDPISGGEAYEHLLLDAAKRGVAPKVSPLDTTNLAPPVADVCKKLETLESRLARGNANEEAIKNLTELAAIDEDYAILAQFIRVESGPGGPSKKGWVPGVLTPSDSSSTLIQAALLSSKTGKVIWKGERLIRYKALKPADDALGKALTELYQDFDVK
jgi:hypothetical protein